MATGPGGTQDEESGKCEQGGTWGTNKCDYVLDTLVLPVSGRDASGGAGMLVGMSAGLRGCQRGCGDAGRDAGISTASAALVGSTAPGEQGKSCPEPLRLPKVGPSSAPGQAAGGSLAPSPAGIPVGVAPIQQRKTHSICK